MKIVPVNPNLLGHLFSLVRLGEQGLAHNLSSQDLTRAHTCHLKTLSKPSLKKLGLVFFK